MDRSQRYQSTRRELTPPPYTKTIMIRIALIVVLLILTSCGKPADVDSPPATPAKAGERVVIPVSGMHCQNCAQAINQGTKTCEGVNAVAASAADEEVVVWIAPGTDLEPIKAKITSLGFKVEHPSEN
jgi:copper chaperone CopZ